MHLVTNVKEYAEEYPVIITNLTKEEAIEFKDVISTESYNAGINERLVIEAQNEGGFNCTQVDLIQLLAYVKSNLPDVWNKI